MELELFGKVEAGMKISSSPTRQIHLGKNDVHDPNIYLEAAILTQVSEGKIAERVAHITRVVKSSSANGSYMGREYSACMNIVSGVPEAVILDAAKADQRVDVLTAEGR